MKVIVIYSFLCLIYSVSAQIENVGECTTPLNTLGQCVHLRQCTSLFNLLLKGRELTPDERHYLSSSQCDYRDNHPLVCCPDFNTTTQIITGDHILPKPGECGSNPMYRIINGIVADLDTYQWMALLEYSKPNNTKGVHCIGVLISTRYVLTAAHCVIGKDNWNLTGVRLGDHDLLTNPDCKDFGSGLDCNPPVVDVTISEKIIHELYNPQSKNRVNDIALLKLQYDIQYSEFVSPICLPRSEMLKNLNYDNSTLEVAGWNRDTNEYSVKLTGRINAIQNTECNVLYNSLGISVQDTQLCGSSRPKNYDSCLGLPGTPIMGVTSNENHVYWYLAGIEAFSLPVCGGGQPDGLPNVYTRVNSYIDWIESKLQA